MDIIILHYLYSKICAPQNDKRSDSKNSFSGCIEGDVLKLYFRAQFQDAESSFEKACMAAMYYSSKWILYRDDFEWHCRLV